MSNCLFQAWWFSPLHPRYTIEYQYLCQYSYEYLSTCPRVQVRVLLLWNLRVPVKYEYQKLSTWVLSTSTPALIPDDWSPVYKKGDVHEPSNYRPVSLTTVACKTLEHIVCKHIVNYLERHKLLTTLQHGFRKAHSCESQLLITIDDSVLASRPPARHIGG